MDDRQEWERVIDLSRYYPGFLKNIRELNHITETEGDEIRRLYQGSDSLWGDGYIRSASAQGIKRWESLLGIKPYPKDSLDDRREVVIAKWNQQLPYTWRRLQERIGAAVGPDGYEMELRNRVYELELHVINQTYRTLQSVRNMTREMIPANLLFIFAGLYPVDIPVITATFSRVILKSDFYARYNREFLYLDGSWTLDGKYPMTGYKEKEALESYPAQLTISGEHKIITGCTIPEMASVAEVKTAPYTDTTARNCGETKAVSEKSNRLTLRGCVFSAPEVDCRLRVEHNLWYLDGGVLLDGSNFLDAEIFEYGL